MTRSTVELVQAGDECYGHCRGKTVRRDKDIELVAAM